jgi:hypothetical protein
MAEAMKKAQVAEIDDLYALPLAEFTPARNALVKRLRSEGEREGAAEAGALRKPTVAAWAVNQLARRERKRIEALLGIGEELREAQRALVAGGDSGGLLSLSERERELVRELVEKTAAILRESGGRASEATLGEVAETLHAAALDEEVAAAVASGRLVKERRAIGLGLEAGGPAPRRAVSRKGAGTKKGRKEGREERNKAAPPARVTKAEQRLAEARAEARERRQAADAAARSLQRAEREARQAERAAERAAERERGAAEALERAKAKR